MSDWSWHRAKYDSAQSALDYIGCANSSLARLGQHATVAVALAQIDMAERAIASVAEELECEEENT